MAYNSAGEGPESQFNIDSIFRESTLQVIGINFSTVKVVWRYVPQSLEEPLQGYKVRVWEVDQDISTGNDTIIGVGSKFEAYISNLSPKKSYHMCVMAFLNGGAAYRVSQTLTLWMGSTFSDSTVDVTRINPSTVKVVLRDMPQSLEETLEGYHVCVWEVDQDMSTGNDTIIGVGSKLEAYISNLSPGKAYHMRVKAFLNGGDSWMSSPTLTFQMDAESSFRVPTVDVMGINPSTVKVVWRFVPQSLEEPLGYKVRVWEVDQDMSTGNDIIIGFGSKLEVYISNLSPGKAYHVRVMAFLNGGDGRISSPTLTFQMGDWPGSSSSEEDELQMETAVGAEKPMARTVPPQTGQVGPTYQVYRAGMKRKKVASGPGPSQPLKVLATPKPALNINCLPDEMLQLIFSYLSQEDLVFGVQRVCQRWRVVACSYVLDKQLVFCGQSISSAEALLLISEVPKLRCLKLMDRNDAAELLQCAARNCKQLLHLRIENSTERHLTAALGAVIDSCKNLTSMKLKNIPRLRVKFFRELCYKLLKLRAFHFRCRFGLPEMDAVLSTNRLLSFSSDAVPPHPKLVQLCDISGNDTLISVIEKK